jgi:hypothetical protein
MIHLVIPGLAKRVHIDNVNDTLSLTMLSGDIVLAFPLFGSSHSFIVTRTGRDMQDVTGRSNTVKAFLEMAECYTDNAHIMISDRWV